MTAILVLRYCQKIKFDGGGLDRVFEKFFRDGVGNKRTVKQKYQIISLFKCELL